MKNRVTSFRLRYLILAMSMLASSFAAATLIFIRVLIYLKIHYKKQRKYLQNVKAEIH